MNHLLLRIGVIAATVVVVFFPTTTYAAERVACSPRDKNQECQGYYISNNIPYYDPESPIAECGTGSPYSSGGSGEVSADQQGRAEAILRFFTSKGMTLAQASGFVGNMMAESSLNPAIIQGGAIAPSDYQPVDGVGFGLVQWTFTSRQKPLVDLAKRTNRSIIDMNLQLDYVWQELTGPYKSTIQKLAAVPNLTPTQAAVIVHDNYEISADTAAQVRSGRGGNAEKFYQQFKDTIQDGSGIEGATSNSSTPAAIQTNCSEIVASDSCSATAPIYGAGGNGHQLTIDEMTKIYGPPNTASNMVSMPFLNGTISQANGINKAIAGCLKAVNDELKANNVNYNIKQIACYRQESMSIIKYHGFGAACDINADDNPCVECGYNPKGLPAGTYDIPKAVIDAFKHHGWSWGGDWGSVKDYMHFEFNGMPIGG